MNGHSDRSKVNALDELRELSHEPDWRAMEARLLDALDVQVTAQPPGRVRARAWWHWTAAAAVIIFAAAVTFYAPSSRFGAALPKGEPLRPLATRPATPPPNEPDRTTRPASPAAPEAPRRSKPTAAAPPTTTGSAPQTAATTYNDFVALPAAFALPDLESGRIVRVEVPLTMLPVYGLDLVPEAARSAVEADFLIGQDGMPRAIRLASTSARDERP
jgi:hypothetical protein